jgi:GT2 family glycosyltransferase
MIRKLHRAYLYLISKNSSKRSYLFFRIKDIIKRYFIYFRSRKGIIESGKFDEKFYLHTYDDVRQADINPLRHYIMYGSREGRIPNANYDNVNFHSSLGNDHHEKISIHKNVNGDGAVNDVFWGPIRHNPLVSIISVNYNGANDLPIYFDSLVNQSYKNFEVIIIDNNSSDQSEAIIHEFKSKIKALKLVKLDENVGFSDGNNQALPYCKGELIALLNVDTRADKDWLKELVDAISVDAKAAAATSKTLFFSRFQDVELSTDNNFSVDPDKLENSLEYKKYFLRIGRKTNGKIHPVNNSVLLSLPIQKNKVIFSINDITTSRDIYIGIKVGKKATSYHFINKNESLISVDLSSEEVINASYMINNAGSKSKNGMPADRGIEEYDQGQYDVKCYMDYFCGCSVLLRRSAIINRKIFVSEFFAYYEDSELSRWLNSNGYRVLYVPRSVIYHRHSETSSEGSDQWNMLVERARAIFTYYGDVKELEIILKHNEQYYAQKVNPNLFNTVVKFNKQLISRLHTNNKLVEEIKSVGIYNSYWNTYGGGEKHALFFANILQQKYTVYLISENDFDIDDLSAYFHLDLSNCRKIVEPLFNEDFTTKFHIFINSTFKSNLKSKANKSYYIVSFPQKDVNKEILNSYHFLYNSDYTKEWAKKYWGNSQKGSVLYPIGGLDRYINNGYSTNHKKKIMLSVGRFFVGGHSKNQHLTAEAFRRLNELYEEAKEWKLVLIGSLDLANHEDVKYYDRIKNILHGLNYEILINAERTLLERFYSESLLYIHATGYGQNSKSEPENFEHFGITPIEAMLNNCYPIVYHLGGPADVLKKIDIGETFEDLEDLTESLYRNIQKFSSKKIEDCSLISNKAKEFLDSHSLKAFIEKLV